MLVHKVKIAAIAVKKRICAGFLHSWFKIIKNIIELRVNIFPLKFSSLKSPVLGKIGENNLYFEIT